jgi:hypothetical protein
MWQNQIRARQIPIQKPGLTAARRQASVDEIIKAVLVATTPLISLPMIGDYEPVEIWQDNDSEPISLPNGKPLVTLRDAANYITKLPKAEHQAEEWQAAMQVLLLVVEQNGPTMFARIGVMRALTDMSSGYSIPAVKRRIGESGSWRGIGDG